MSAKKPFKSVFQKANLIELQKKAMQRATGKESLEEIYSESELRQIRIIEQVNTDGANATCLREAVRFLVLANYNGIRIGWERATLAVVVADLVMKNLEVDDNTSLGEELWLMLANAARQFECYSFTADQSLVKAEQFISSGEAENLVTAAMKILP